MSDPQPIFTGLLVLDGFGVVMRSLLMLFAVLFVAFTWASGVPNDYDATEFYVMIFGATIGLCIMVTANHVLMVFLGIEMASVPCYVLAGILRHRRASSEAALKYVVFGGATAGVMLYGLSLLTGVLGSAHLPTMAQRLAAWLSQTGDPHHQATAMVLLLGGLMTMVGLAFKLSAVPFHFWAPDVFEGAPAEVGTFLSIASKAAAVALLTRLALIFSGCLDAAPQGRGGRGGPGPRAVLPGLAHRLAGRRDLHLRQPGGLRPDEHQAPAGLFDDRPRRLHDDAGRRGRCPGRRCGPSRDDQSMPWRP